jgi:hypothetical protein
MKITESSGIKSASDVKRRRKIGDGGGVFSEYLEAASTSETGAADATLATSDVAAVSNLLALQEITPYDVERKKLVQRGKNMLDSLEELRQQILMGIVPLHTLQNLGRQLAMQKQNIADPQLIEIIEDIELRAAVELAKLEVSRGAVK